MAVTIQKYLGQKDAEDVKKIVSDINSAKGPEESVDGYVRLDTTLRISSMKHYCIYQGFSNLQIKLLELGMKAIANQYEIENNSTAAATLNSIQ